MSISTTLFLNGAPFQRGVSTLASLIDNKIRKCSEAWASIAFVLSSGMDQVAALKEPLHASKLKLFAGIDFGQTETEALRDLISNGAYVGILRNDLLGPPKTRGIFHPKVWFWKQDQTASALIGSANLSERAITDKNTEACLLLEGKSSESLFKQLQDYFRVLTQKAESVTPSNLKSIEAELRRLRRAFAAQIRAGLPGSWGEYFPASNSVLPEETPQDAVGPVDLGELSSRLGAVVTFESDTLPISGQLVYFSTDRNWGLSRNSRVLIVQAGVGAPRTRGILVAVCHVVIDSESPVSPDALGKPWDWELDVPTRTLRVFNEHRRQRKKYQRVLEVTISSQLPTDSVSLLNKDNEEIPLIKDFIPSMKLQGPHGIIRELDMK